MEPTNVKLRITLSILQIGGLFTFFQHPTNYSVTKPYGLSKHTSLNKNTLKINTCDICINKPAPFPFPSVRSKVKGHKTMTPPQRFVLRRWAAPGGVRGCPWGRRGGVETSPAQASSLPRRQAAEGGISSPQFSSSQPRTSGSSPE